MKMRGLLAILLLLCIKPAFTQKTPIYVAAPSGLTLREGPSSRSRKIELLAYGTKITNYSYTEHSETIDGYNGSWCRIALNGKDGYIFSGFTLPLTPPKENTKSILDFFIDNFGQPLLEDSALNYINFDGTQFIYTHYYKNSTTYTFAPLHDGFEYSLINLNLTTQEAYLLFYLLENNIPHFWKTTEDKKLLPFNFPTDSYKNNKIEVKKLSDYREYFISGEDSHFLKIIFLHARIGLVWGD